MQLGNWAKLLAVSGHLLLLAQTAVATTVHLVWSGTTGSGSLGANTIEVSPSTRETLTLDIAFDLDSRGVSGAFISLEFDRDFANELNVIAYEKLDWTSKKASLMPIIAPTQIQTSQESSPVSAGQLYTFESVSAGIGPSSTTLTFARIVFETNPGNIASDGDDIFSGLFYPADFFGDNTLPLAVNIASSVVFGTAAVNLVPEPRVIVLLGFGICCLAATSRRNRQRAP